MTTLAGGLQRLLGKTRRRARPVETEISNSAATTGGSVSQEPAVVWQAANPMEAQIVKGRLQSAGIPAIVRGESMGRIYGFVYGGLAERDVLVPAALAESAQELLSEEVHWDLDDEDNGDSA